MSDHRQRTVQKEYVEYLCDEPSCEFYGKQAAQGVCHATETEVADIDKLYTITEEFATNLREFHQKNFGDDKDEYIAYLESLYECTMLNWTFNLDECIRLRKENAILKLRLEKCDESKP